MLRTVIGIGITVSLLLFTFGCSPNSTQSPSATIESQSLTIALVLTPGLADSLSKATAIVSAPDMDTIFQELTIGENQAFGTVKKIPLGHDRHVEVKLCDKHGVVVFYGDATADVLSSKAVNVDINLKRIEGTIIINGTIESESTIEELFIVDESTVFCANFNNNLMDLVTETNGTVTGGSFVAALFGTGLKIDPTSTAKAIYRFPQSAAISITEGSLEALCFADSLTSDYNHIIDKSWLYGLTAYNGKIGLNFGSNKWFSSIAMPLKEWAYICGSYDGEIVRLYLNGEIVDSSAYSPGSVDLTYNLGIGNADASSHNVPFRGTIDGVRISTVARSAEEVALVWAAVGKQLP